MAGDDDVPEGQQDKYLSHVSHKLSAKDKVHHNPPHYRRLRTPHTRSWWGTGKRRPIEDALQTAAPYGLRKELYDHWSQMYQTERKTLDSSRRLSLYNICNSYRDVLRPWRSVKSKSPLDAYLIHSLNHSLKSIDQGFTRPKVLILVPVARDAHLLVTRLFQLYPSANMDNAKGLKLFNSRIVKDSENEDFIISIKLEREGIRLYGSYTNSDILVASPLALVSKIWLAEKAKNKNKIDVHVYLSSIELMVVDYSRRKDLKNWAYVPTIADYLNSLSAMDDDDLSVRPWHIGGEARYYRQTIIFSSSVNQDIVDVFYQQCMNFEGKMELSNKNPIRRRFPFSSHSLPEGDCIIALSYPPGNKLMACVRKSKPQNFFIPQDFPRNFAIHGSWQGDVSNVGNLAPAKIEVSEDWKRLLVLCMPNVTNAAKNITKELKRHGTHIDFLDGDSYVQFVVCVFLRYRFDRLMSFLCEWVRTDLKPEDVTTIQYLGHEWIGISVTHLAECFRQYDPIRFAELIIKLLSHREWFFLYEILTHVTKNGNLAQRMGQAVRATAFKGKNTSQVKVHEESIVYFLSV